MTYKLSDIQLLVTERTGCELAEVQADTDIHYDLGCGGDDFDDLMQAYTKTFGVDMTSYLWYFHTDEEGNNFGANFFKTPYERVTRIPVTPAMLLEFANEGKWNIPYPPHILPKRRYDLLINLFLLVLLVAVILHQCSQ